MGEEGGKLREPQEGKGGREGNEGSCCRKMPSTGEQEFELGSGNLAGGLYTILHPSPSPQPQVRRCRTLGMITAGQGPLGQFSPGGTQEEGQFFAQGSSD